MAGKKNAGKARNRMALEEGATTGKLKGQPVPRVPRGTKPKPRHERGIDYGFDQAAPEPDPDASPRLHREWVKAEEERVARKELCERLGLNPWAAPERQKDGHTRFTEAHYDAVLTLLADGWLIVRQSREFPGLPGRSAVYEKAQTDKAFAGRFARANQLCNLAIEEQTFEIAEDGRNDWVMGESGPILDREHVTRSKLRIDTRFNLLRIRDRHRYGDKLDLDANVQTTVTRKVFKRGGKPDGDKA